MAINLGIANVEMVLECEVQVGFMIKVPMVPEASHKEARVVFWKLSYLICHRNQN